MPRAAGVDVLWSRTGGALIMSGFIKLFTEIAQAWRRAVRRPLRFATSLVVLASVIASASTVWSLLTLLIARPLPYPEAARLVSVYGVLPSDRENPAAAGLWNRRMLPWEAWQLLSTASTFEGVGAWAPVQLLAGFPIEGQVQGWYASSSLLRLLTAGPVVGRLLSQEDDMAARSDVVLISSAVWHARYGARPDIIGTLVTFTGQANEREVRRIAGVFPSGLRLRNSAPDYVFPIGPRGPNGRRRGVDVYIVARLARDSTPEAANATVASIASQFPTASRELEARAVPLWDDVVAPATPPVWLLVTSAVILLVVAASCALAADLSEAVTRRQETAVRTALGASPAVMALQVFAERLILVCIGGPIGYIFAAWSLRAVMYLAPLEVSALLGDSDHLLVTGFVGALAMSAGAIIFPVIANSFRISPSLSVVARNVSSAPSGRWLDAVPVVQIALAIVLVVVANLLIATFFRLTTKAIGFSPENVAVLSLKISEYPRAELVGPGGGIFATWAHTEGLLKAVEAVPGVLRAAAVNAVPFGGAWPAARVTLPLDPQMGELNVQMQVVTTAYFDVMRIPLRAGRQLDAGDRQVDPAQPVVRAVASAELARVFGGAIGHRLKSVATGREYEIVGIVGNVKQRNQADTDIPTLYILNLTYSSVHEIVYRYSTDQHMLAQVADAARRYDPSIVITRSALLEDVVAQAIAPERFRAFLASIFAITTVLLAMLGSYAIATRIVASRRREIAVRLALGATIGGVVAAMAGRALRLVGVALLLGLPCAVLLAMVLRGMVLGATLDVGLAIAATLIVSAAFITVFVVAGLRAFAGSQIDILRS